MVMARTGGPEKPSARDIGFYRRKGQSGAESVRMRRRGLEIRTDAQVVSRVGGCRRCSCWVGCGGECAGFSIAMAPRVAGSTVRRARWWGAQAAFDKSAGLSFPRQSVRAAFADDPTIRFTLADMATGAVSLQTNVVGRPLQSLTATADDKVKLCADAKRYVTAACYYVAASARQFARGYGYLREYGLERSVARLRCTASWRDHEIMRVVIGRACRPHWSGAPRRMTRIVDSSLFLGRCHMGVRWRPTPRRRRPHRTGVDPFVGPAATARPADKAS